MNHRISTTNYRSVKANVPYFVLRHGVQHDIEKVCQKIMLNPGIEKHLSMSSNQTAASATLKSELKSVLTLNLFSDHFQWIQPLLANTALG